MSLSKTLMDEIVDVLSVRNKRASATNIIFIFHIFNYVEFWLSPGFSKGGAH